MTQKIPVSRVIIRMTMTSTIKRHIVMIHVNHENNNQGEYHHEYIVMREVTMGLSHHHEKYQQETTS